MIHDLPDLMLLQTYAMGCMVVSLFRAEKDPGQVYFARFPMRYIFSLLQHVGPANDFIEGAKSHFSEYFPCLLRDKPEITDQVG